MKYKIIKTDILYKGELYKEGSEIELTQKEADHLSNFLEPLDVKKGNPSRKLVESQRRNQNQGE